MYLIYVIYFIIHSILQINAVDVNDGCNGCECTQNILNYVHANCNYNVVQMRYLLNKFERNIDSIDFTEQNFIKLQKYFFYNNNLSEIDKIILKNCNLQVIDEFAFTHTNKIRHLDLSNNMLKNFHIYTFYESKNIKFLNISNNKLQKINSDVFSHLVLLEILDLSYNKITVIDENFLQKNINIKTLLLDHNSIIKINYKHIQNLSGLKHLTLNNNPWFCDRDIKDLVDKTKILQILPKDHKLQCFAPDNLRGKQLTELTSTDFLCKDNKEQKENCTKYEIDHKISYKEKEEIPTIPTTTVKNSSQNNSIIVNNSQEGADLFSNNINSYIQNNYKTKGRIIQNLSFSCDFDELPNDYNWMTCEWKILQKLKKQYKYNLNIDNNLKLEKITLNLTIDNVTYDSQKSYKYPIDSGKNEDNVILVIVPDKKKKSSNNKKIKKSSPHDFITTSYLLGVSIGLLLSVIMNIIIVLSYYFHRKKYKSYKLLMRNKPDREGHVYEKVDYSKCIQSRNEVRHKLSLPDNQSINSYLEPITKNEIPQYTTLDEV